MVYNRNTKFRYHFVPKEFIYLTQQNKIQYKEKNLKTAYLISIIHDLITKYYFTLNNDQKFNLYSKILRKKYGEFYNYYIQYLIDNKFMFLISKYYVGKKTNTYKINIDYVYDIIRWKNYDKMLMKKLDRDFLECSITENSNSPIDLEVRKVLVNNLNKIKISLEEATQYLDKLKENNEIDQHKHQKNIISINNISINNIYFKFDSFGRFHTNYTILKKEVRNNYLSINNEVLSEIDIKNSQPFFFAILLRKSLPGINGDTQRYFELVKKGLLYDDIIEKSNLKTKKQAKELMYKVLFGNNKENKRNNTIFKKLYPSVHEYIIEFKEQRKNYKELAHLLQKMESNFIFNVVIKEIIETYPNMPFFTVHDSILFPRSKKEEIEEIFNKHYKKILSEI